MKKTRVWTGIGASILVTTLGAETHALAPTAQKPEASNAHATETMSGLRTTGTARVWPISGESSEGGEAGIDAKQAASDPVEWHIALGVIAAHYLAGWQAYSTGKTEPGAEMFAHGYSEVYAELEAAFKERGFTDLGRELLQTIEITSANAPSSDVKTRVDNVLALLAEAETKGPKGSATVAARSKAIADMIDRAAIQYTLAIKSTEYEPYLDGLGFALAAKQMADKTLPSLTQTNPDTAKALANGIEFSLRAYPSAARPTTPPVESKQFLAAASRAKLSVSDLR